ncbi:MAG TPA: vanadium-dependent haloperoxidase [Blastocatellia bacterium]|nr:vanadium-dependent haloperoxidase [Blastocatellia bacterium]
MRSSSTRRFSRHFHAALLLFVFVSCAALSTSARADAVTDWDVIAFKIVEDSGKTGPATSCDIAMAHVAMHDALNAIDRRYNPYAYDSVAPRGASPVAAIAAAAHGVLVGRIPNQKTALDAALASALAAVPEGKAKADGIATGQAAAAAILARRATDGANVVTPYTPGVEPGVWRPTPPAFTAAIGAGFGRVRPFTLTSSEQFGPPPAAYFDLRSPEYTADYKEVKRIGGGASKARTAEQTKIARFWYETSPGVHIRLARDLVGAQKLNLWDSARLFALLHLACADSLIAGYGVKYRYNFWRPVTAIRDGANDGNPQTIGDQKWNSYLETPSHPEYLSLHAVLAAAWAEVLCRFFGTDQFSFTVTSAAPYPGIKRSFRSFSQSAQEAADSRVYAGIHFRTSCSDGLAIGRKIGEHVFSNFLRPMYDDYLQDARYDDYITSSKR